MMVKEIVSPVEASRSTETLIISPPQIILVFDFESTGEEKKTQRLKAQLRGDVAGSVGEEIASDVMDLRAAVAALIYHSSLYDGKEKPKVCCFAGAHKPGGKAGSTAVKEHLLKFGVNEEDIVTREATITTKFDIMQLFAYMAVHQLTGPAAIITTDWHVSRVIQELKNNRTYKTHPDKYKVYVLGPSSEVLAQLPYSAEKTIEMQQRLQEISSLKEKDPGGGLTEKIAYLLSRLSANPLIRKTGIQQLAEDISHPDKPERLNRMITAAKKIGTRK